MKKTALILFAMLLVLIPTFRASAYDTADGHAVMDFATEVTAGEQKVNEAMLITSNTIGGEGTIAGTRIENGELKIPAAGTGIVFVSYLKPNTWGATDFTVDLDRLKFIAFNYKTDSDAKIFVYFETAATEGGDGISYAAGVIEHWVLPATGGEYKTVVAAVPANAAGTLKHWRVDRLIEGTEETEVSVKSIGFFANEAAAKEYYEPKNPPTPPTPDTGDVMLAVSLAAVSGAVVLVRKKR